MKWRLCFIRVRFCEPDFGAVEHTKTVPLGEIFLLTGIGFRTKGLDGSVEESERRVALGFPQKSRLQAGAPTLLSCTPGIAQPVFSWWLGSEELQLLFNLSEHFRGDAAIFAAFARFHRRFADADLVLVFSPVEFQPCALDPQPFGDLFAFPAILEAAVDLLADGLGQPRNFAIPSHRVYCLFGFIDLH